MRLFALASLMAMAASLPVQGQDVLFQSNFDSDDGFNVVTASDDTAFEFGYDYSNFDGVPEAPRSDGLSGDARTGLKMEANLLEGAATSLVAATDGLELSGNYQVEVDIWLNFNIPAGASGTTEYGGLSVGHGGEVGGFDGATFIYDTDGDSSRDYILYKNDVRQELDTEQYAVDSLNNSAEVFTEAFPPVNVADVVPEQLIDGETRAGAGGFRWMTLRALVNTEGVGAGVTDDKGLATFWLTDAVTGNEVEIGTIDNSNGGDVVNMDGDVALVFADIFSSVSNDDTLSFGLFDNLVISEAAPSDPLDCDANGTVDSGDVSCATADTIGDTLAAAGLIRGDLDFNGAVEFADFLQLSQNFGSAVDGYSQGDIDLDGQVAFSDFLALSATFGSSSAAAAAVPEPSSAWIMLIGMVSLAGRRRVRR